MKEGQLDGLAPEPKERLLLPFLTAERHAGVAAERAEGHGFPAAPPEAVHTKIAEHFQAMGALMGHALLGMAGANQGPIGQHHRRSRAGHIEAGNGNGDIGCLDQQLDLSQVQGLSG
jgi:hypothetical protein